MSPDDQTLRHQLRVHEGSRSKPYTDSVGKTTIGVGRNLTDVGLSHDEIELLLTNDLRIAIDDISTFPWWFALDAVRQRVLVDMRFQLGGAGFRGFTSTIAAVARGDYPAASTHMLASKWAQQVPSRAATLAHAMQSGVMHL